MSRIFWDTNLFVYLLEDTAERGQRVAELRRRMIERGDRLYTSTLALGEVLIKPREMGQRTLARSFRELIIQGATVVPFDLEAADRFADIRADRSVKAPDAIHLACAATVGMDLFITNDARLSDRRVEGVQFITSLERAFL